ncbi:MAG: hypothetical protein JST64_08015 [Actinobacteria bacterium]|nr:hypothetical protein [Actinomycetota bacterium]
MANPDDVHVSIRLQSPARPLQPRALHRASIRGSAVPERSYLPVGTVDAGILAYVDEAGAVQLADATWCLEWWIGAEDRWHHPARETAVRQRALDGSPVVETALRVPGGDVLARVYGVQTAAGARRGPAVVVEVENRTAVPVALAFAVRPVLLDGVGSVRSVRSSGADVVVDGRDAILLAREAPRVVSGRRGEVADLLASGGDAAGPLDVADVDGDLEAAFVVPLTHTAISRVLLPVGDGEGGPATSPWDAPSAEAVARGWSTHAGGDLRIVVPEPGWEDGLRWAAAMLRLVGPDEVGACLDRRRTTPAGPAAALRAAEVAEAMARLGAADGLAPIARGLAQAQRLGGEVRLGDRSDGTVALLHAVGGALCRHLDPESDLVADLLAPAAVAVRRIRKGRGVPDGLAPSAARALRMLVAPLLAIGQPGVADDAAAAAGAVALTPHGAGGHAVAHEPGATGSSTLEAALVARRVVAEGAGPAAAAAVRACWAGVATRGRSDLERSGRGAGTIPAGVLGFDAAELAARTNALLDVFARVDVASGGAAVLALASGVDPSWYGQSVEAHGMASPWGKVGFAVRWHGARPALLWQVDDVDDAGDAGDAGDRHLGHGLDEVTLTAAGLDPSWRGSGRSGDALLAAPAAPAAPAPGP